MKLDVRIHTQKSISQYVQLPEMMLQLCLHSRNIHRKIFPHRSGDRALESKKIPSNSLFYLISSHLDHSEAFWFFRGRIKHLHLYYAAFHLNSRIYDLVSYPQIANYLQMFTSESLLRTTEQGQLTVFDVSRYFKSSFWMFWI